MKKFLITLFILIILGGVAFFFGWVQFSVPVGSVGVLQSKTHGIDPKAIRPGEFRWVWYALIPANVKISVFKIDPVQHTMKVRGELPSGNIYALFAGGQIDFSWEFETFISYNLKSSEIVSLAAEYNIISQDELLAYQDKLSAEIETYMISYVTAPEKTKELEKIMAFSSTDLEESVLEQFPKISNFSCMLKINKYPDFALYHQVKGLYEDFLNKQREFTALSMGKKAENRIEMMLRMDELERYGELLTKYPILIQYLGLIQGAVLP